MEGKRLHYATTVASLLVFFALSYQPVLADNAIVARIDDALGRNGFATTATQDRRVSVQIHDHPDAAFEALGKLDAKTLASIKTLILQKPCRNPESAVVLEKLSSLESLDIFCENGWNKGIANAVAKSRTIDDLWGEGSGIDPYGLRQIAKAKQMQVLMIGRNPFKGSDLECFKDLTNLTQLSLTEIEVSARDLQFLERCENLRWLDLSTSPVDDDIIPIVSKCKNLLILSLTGTKVTKEGSQQLRKNLPFTIISTDHGLQAPTKRSE